MVAVGLVLSAVFLPCMFFPGIVGLFFRQFALTIAISTLISTFNSLSLCPALAVVLLQPKSAGAGPDIVTRAINFWALRLVLLAVQQGLRPVRRLGVPQDWSAGFIRIPLILLVVYARAMSRAGVSHLVRRSPAGFIPTQDKGYLIASVQLADAAVPSRPARSWNRSPTLRRWAPRA